ncbi:Helicase conserved C-terminal domain-containing protein [Desulfacinum infernum DSM 9756]|uniref:DEAD-box ATP-dependent RNA helicase RhpA n=1 Tax=Desulfacinum infernum DSM 9756 TaxID=1121391 RepID=A0A1M5FA21_9BACT|nr:DEAD/DEAH box helicase [Desulfacinum infernum]SHF88326.1 Helicase conserved C-terminal domain-containing protein [Desulfacinum infernum DSM 9756]
MNTFTDIHLDAILHKNLQRVGFRTPTPIQARAIPAALAGRDLIGLAQTGTGKTAAFGLPILQKLLKGQRRTLRALILAPTRELTEQTRTAMEQLGRDTRLSVLSLYGGVGIQPQITALRRGVDIAACCPGRLLDHMNRGTIDLDSVEILVLDEADRMFDMGFLPDIQKIVARLPKVRQTLLFSATMPPAIKALARQLMRDPQTIQVGASAPVESVSHTFYPVGTAQKGALLKDILGRLSRGRVIVFTRTKHRSTSLARQLSNAGHRAVALNGDMPQGKRQRALDGFHRGRYQVLVATDVAARGIDVSKVSHVINFDIPDTVDAYIHRVGRTGRACETGEAFTFVCSEDRFMETALKRTLGDSLSYCILDEYSPPRHQQPAVRSFRPARRNRRPAGRTAHAWN